MSGELYKERVKLFKDTVALKKTERIPNLSNFFTWKIFDSEFGLKEALYDYKKMEKLVCDFHERYQFDAYMDLGVRNPMAVTDALGGGFSVVNDEKESISFVDHVLMDSSEYKDYAKDPHKYNKLLFQRKFPNLTTQAFGKGIQEFLNFGQFAMKMTNTFVNKYQCPSVFDMTGVVLHPFEFFFSTARGIKAMSMDVRRAKSEIIAAMEAIYETSTKGAFEAALAAETSAYVCDTYTALLGYSILSEKQFAELYWPILKKFFDRLIATNKTMYIFCESTMLRFADFFNEVPKGHLVIHLELDDIFEARKRMPNVCLAGGMTTDLLGKGTPQQCVDYAKKLIDELGEGYIFSQNKMVSFRNDCKRENLLAVNDFVRNYRV